MDIKNFYRKDIDTFYYWPLRPCFMETSEYKKGFIKINMGENVFNVPNKIMKKISSLTLKYYPGISDELLNIIANRNNVTKDNIFLGNGSLALIELIIRLFVDPGEEIIVFSPTYPLYEYYAQLARAKTVLIPRKNFQEIDLRKVKSIINNKTKVIFLDTPSNPFGYQVFQEDVKKLLNLGIITVIDEAYYEFSSQTCLDLLSNYPNLIVLRTFSKVIGLAGARIGYLITSREIRSSLIKIKNDEEVNTIAQFLAKEILKIDLKPRIEKLIQGRTYLINNLKKFSFLKVYNSQGGYVVAELIDPNMSIDNVCNLFYKNRILIKKMDFPNMKGNFLRFNVVPINIAKKIVNIFKKCNEI